jgi:hypothetical protein
LTLRGPRLTVISTPRGSTPAASPTIEKGERTAMRVREADIWEDDLVDHPLDDTTLRQLSVEVALDDEEDDGISFHSLHEDPERLTWRGLADLSKVGGFHIVASNKRHES